MARAGREAMICPARAVCKHFFLSFLVVAERQLTLLLDCRARGRSTRTTLAPERGTASIALDIHLDDRGIVDQPVDCSEGHRLVGKDRAPLPND